MRVAHRGSCASPDAIFGSHTEGLPNELLHTRLALALAGFQAFEFLILLSSASTGIS
jgi:hypothetical protein